MVERFAFCHSKIFFLAIFTELGILGGLDPQRDLNPVFGRRGHCGIIIAVYGQHTGTWFKTGHGSSRILYSSSINQSDSD